MGEFVQAAQAGDHTAQGWPNTSYGTTKVTNILFFLTYVSDIRSLVCLAVYFINKQAQTKHVCLLPFLDWCDCAIKDPG